MDIVELLFPPTQQNKVWLLVFCKYLSLSNEQVSMILNISMIFQLGACQYNI